MSTPEMSNPAREKLACGSRVEGFYMDTIASGQIIDQRPGKDGGREFRVRWDNHGYGDSDWIEEHELKDTKHR